ncbi:hypothetical protein [Candidatus Clostridium radicumherbarum]|uniref:Uncharacterized protein n=1 Tax=Candidatus Clostridium radicumherbarum TaxID=3381662 RepID=A0ABW8TTD9_9CLOT
MKSNKTCSIVEQCLCFLVLIKVRSENVILEYSTELLMFFMFVLDANKIPIANPNFKVVNLNFIKLITLSGM